MEAIYGLALLSASVLLLAFAARFRNGPNAPEWAQSGVLLQAILFTTVTGIVFGISMLVRFAANFKTASFGVTEVALAGAVVVATWALWRAIKAMPKKAASAEAGIIDMPPPANTDGPALRSGRKAPGTRKAA